MQLTLDRSQCAHHPTACEGCLAQFLQTGAQPARGCLGPPVDDGQPEITIRIKSGDSYGTLVVTDENRDEIIYHGWMQFAQLSPDMLQGTAQTPSLRACAGREQPDGESLDTF
ncbi:MAG: hypothetical protein WCF84_18540 [Anaerolineae bacterium]